MVEVVLNPIKNNASQSKSKYLNVDEIQKFREIDFLHHSNLLRLQIDQMVLDLEIKKTTKVKLQKYFAKLSAILTNLPKSRQFELSDLKWMEEHNLNFPVKELSELPSMKGIFTFMPPTEVLMVGSHALETSSTNSNVIDVILVLPKEIMQHKDLYNGRWILRRALYLTWIGKLLKETKLEKKGGDLKKEGETSGKEEEEENLISSVSWTLQCGSRLRPVLQVTPAGKLGRNWKFNLFPVPDEDYFKINLISPLKGNISHSWFYKKEKSDDISESPPSPYYNWACGVDVVVQKHHKLIEDLLKHTAVWIQGLQLLKIWLKQRNLTLGEDSFSSHLMTLLVVYLVKSRKITLKMSEYTVFRTALLTIVQTDWTQEGLSLFEKLTITDRNVVAPSLQDFHKLYPVVFVDNTGFFNIAGNVSLELYKQLKYEARISIEMLDKVMSPTTCFNALFMDRREFLLCSDQMVKISLDNDHIQYIRSKLEEDSPHFEVDRLGNVKNGVFSRIVSVLAEGLEERVDLICVSKEGDLSWDYGRCSSDENQNLILGFCVNPSLSVALLTKGPSADTEEAAKFRKFWGEMSSLRRFRDSTFHEAVLWMENGAPVGDRRLILGIIVKYIMKHHFLVPSKKIHYIASQLENVLRPLVSIKQDNFKYGTGEELNSSAIISFDNLAKKLRSLSLPLQVTNIQSMSDVLKHAIVYPPLPVGVPKPFVQRDSKRLKTDDNEFQRFPVTKTNGFQLVSDEDMMSPFYRPSINVQVFLEISGKWPDDLLAIKGIKLEFLLKISQLLRKDGITCVCFPNYLLVVWEGYVFSIQICYRREIYLLKTADSIVDSETERHDTDASFALEKEIEILPKLTSSLNSLQSQYSCFSGSVRLIRRWVSSQLLIPYFPHIVIDIIVAYLFLSPYPYSTPNTPHVALLRFLKLMSSTDWSTTLLFVNIRKEITIKDENELTKRFTNSRDFFPSLFICTPCEFRPLPDVPEPTPEDWTKRLRYASCWSRTNPTKIILCRMKVIAEAALKIIESSLWKKNFDFKALFRPQLDDYHVLIYLDENQISRRLENIDNKEEIYFENYTHLKGELLPVTNFDPVQLYLKELKETFSDVALFFNDEHGGTVIGVVWKPHVFELKEPRKSNIAKSKVVGTNDIKLITNTEAIIEEFQILGSGLVKDIKINKINS